MSDPRPAYDDEIDLVELFGTLWDGKWLISLFVLLASLVGFGYSQVAQPQYEVSVPYRVNTYSVISHQICESNIGESNIECLATVTFNVLLGELGYLWSVNDRAGVISIKTLRPMRVEEYEALISNALTNTNAVIKSGAAYELAVINGLLADAVLGTERVATNMLNAMRVIQFIEDGGSVVDFGGVSVLKTSPKTPLIISLSIVMGVMLGSSFVLARNALRKRKEKAVNT